MDQPKLKSDKLILSRINTRESSTLTFATVGASASLVVLGLTIENSYPWWIPYVGIAFALLGFVYREITIWSIDRTDYNQLSFLGRTSKKRPAALLRGAIVHVFLLLPIVAWVAFAWDFNFVYASIVAVTVAVIFSVCSVLVDP